MRAIISRIRRLENAAAPAERERAAVEAILAARRRRLGADYVEPIPFPPESYAGCRTIANRMLRTRKLRIERQVVEAQHRGKSQGSRIATDNT